MVEPEHIGLVNVQMEELYQHCAEESKLEADKFVSFYKGFILFYSGLFSLISHWGLKRAFYQLFGQYFIFEVTLKYLMFTSPWVSVSP